MSPFEIVKFREMISIDNDGSDDYLGSLKVFWFNNCSARSYYIEVRDSLNEYLAPVRDGSELLPDWESCRDAVAAGVTWKDQADIQARRLC